MHTRLRLYSFTCSSAAKQEPRLAMLGSTPHKARRTADVVRPNSELYKRRYGAYGGIAVGAKHTRDMRCLGCRVGWRRAA
eukprot:5908128-Prymnesium_polylepis.1